MVIGRRYKLIVKSAKEKACGHLSSLSKKPELPTMNELANTEASYIEQLSDPSN